MDDIKVYPSTKSILLPAYLCAAAWAFLAAWFALFLVSLTGWIPAAFLMGVLYVFLVIAALYVLAALFAPCLNCERLIFVEGFRKKSPTFVRNGGLNYFSTTVVNVLKRRPFQCMYCGAAFRLSGKSSSDGS
ncbi:MAG: hypothetical protein K2W84_09125 [Burkholderiales bacterium]|nr:hypothetical protein [Burkholderiales bacterium]